MSAAALLFTIASAVAAQPPNFAGRWVLAPDPPATTHRGGRPAPGSQGAGWGSDLTVTQDATSLTIEYARFARGDMQPPTKLVYLLDGSESHNPINVGRGPQDQVSRAKWDGARLVITTQHRFIPSPGGQVMTSETTHVLSLESPASLVVETTRAGVMGGPSSTARTIYRKN